MNSDAKKPQLPTPEVLDSLRTRRRIAVMVQTSSAWSRQVLAGVAEYALEAGGWDFWVEPRGFYEKIVVPESWRGEGVICRVTSDELVQQIEQRGLPAVNVSWLGEHTKTIPKVVSDEVACGQMAAEFYLKRGWHFFGFVGPPPRMNYSDQVEKAFVSAVTDAGRAVQRFDHAPNAETITIGQEHPKMAEWLMSLPKPVALLVWTTAIGQEIALLCRQLGIAVPDDVAILAVELDPLISAMSPVPIAYIDQSPRRVGSQAAALLERMIQGEPAPEQPILVPPRRIAERMSVDNLFVEDEVVRQAMNFIREKIAEPIQVTDVAANVAVSRRVLENRFEKALRRSPAQVIRRTKLAHAMYLLSETDLTVQEIGFQTGFFHQETFLRFFKRESGSTPTEYRSETSR